MSIERLSLDNRLKLAFIFSWETFWDYVMHYLFFSFWEMDDWSQQII